MKLIGKRTTIICLVLFTVVNGEIVIRRAITADSESILDFDRRISFEHFKPRYIQGYPHLPLGKDPDYYLEQEIIHDTKWFPECIKEASNQPLFIAVAPNTKTVVGLIIFHKVDVATVQIDLILVDSQYQRQGIGKRLMKVAFDYCKEVSSYIVYPLRYGNDEALRFYQALGFKDCGLAAADKISVYGIPYSELYYLYIRTVTRRGLFRNDTPNVLTPFNSILRIR